MLKFYEARISEWNLCFDYSCSYWIHLTMAIGYGHWTWPLALAIIYRYWLLPLAKSIWYGHWLYQLVIAIGFSKWLFLCVWLSKLVKSFRFNVVSNLSDSRLDLGSEWHSWKNPGIAIMGPWTFGIYYQKNYLFFQVFFLTHVYM